MFLYNPVIFFFFHEERQNITTLCSLKYNQCDLHWNIMVDL